MTTGQLLETFTARLAALDPTFEDCLNPPRPDVDDVLAQLCAPYAVPSGLQDLYGTADGEAGSFSSGILFGMRFLPVAEISRYRAEWAQEREGGLWDEDDDVTLPQDYHVPLFTDFNGNAAALNLRSGHMEMVGADYDHPEDLTDTLDALLSWAIDQAGQVGHLEIQPWAGFRTSITFRNRVIVPTMIHRGRRTGP